MPPQMRDSWGNWIDLPDLVNEESSGAQQVRLLGPFNVTWETADIDQGVSLAAIPANALVVKAWAVITDDWTAGTLLYVGVGNSGSLTHPLAIYDGIGLGNGFAENPYVTDGDPINGSAQNLGGLNLFVGAFTTPGPLAEGEATVYALIAEPAL